MRCLSSTLAIAVFTPCAGLPARVAAQTPQPTPVPRIEVTWLASLAPSPPSYDVSPSAGGR
jgi:hypothetical protein